MSETLTIRPIQPYIVKAADAWLRDSNLTPFIKVDTSEADVVVPKHLIGEDGILVLNVGMNAAYNLTFTERGYDFKASFGGQPFRVFVPYGAIRAIYAREKPDLSVLIPKVQHEINESEVVQATSPSTETDQVKLKQTKVPHLKLVQ